jgi:hypothetical protein
MLPEGYENIGLLTVSQAMERFLVLLDAGQTHPRKTPEKRKRGAETYRRYLKGEDSAILAGVFGLSNCRVRSIIEWERKHAEH